MNWHVKLLRSATALALITAVISGTNNFLAKIALKTSFSPVAYTTLKNSLVAILLIALFLLFKQRLDLTKLNRRQIFFLLAIGVVGGSIPFALFFTGLSLTSAINAALIHKTLFIWVAILAIPLLKERISRWQWLAVVIIFAANLLIGGFNKFDFSRGELLIFLATIFWAIENVIAKKALIELPTLLVASARLTVGSLLLIGYLIMTTGLPNLANLTSAQWSWTLLTSVLMLGYVLTWYAALKRAPASYVATLLVPATLVTNVLSVVFLTHDFNKQQILSALLFIFGSIIFIGFARTTKFSINLDSTKPHGRFTTLH
jgi:drug/metabolite transporter (DMT)-like permease